MQNWWFDWVSTPATWAAFLQPFLLMLRAVHRSAGWNVIGNYLFQTSCRSHFTRLWSQSQSARTTGVPFILQAPQSVWDHNLGRMWTWYISFSTAARHHPERNGDGHELEDSLTSELEMMHYLSSKEIQTKLEGKNDKPYSLAQRDFLNRHLAIWIPPFRRDIEEKSTLDFFRSLARAWPNEFVFDVKPVSIIDIF